MASDGGTRLLLIGAGHAHLYLVREAAALTEAGYDVHLVAPRHFHYSGVASATAVGALSRDYGRIDVSALAQRCGVTFHEGTLVSLDRGSRVAVTSGGSVLRYDVLSLNIGSAVVTPPGMSVGPEVVRVKPLSNLEGLQARLDVSPRPATGVRLTIVGGGASGLELAAQLSLHRSVTTVQLLEADSQIGADFPTGARERIETLLADRGVLIRTGCPVRHLEAHAAHLDDGTELSHNVAVLATGLAAPPLVAALGLGDLDGVPVRETLQHVELPEVYAVGDCAHFLPRPLPRIGVHGVRQGPVLHRSLLARAAGDPLPAYSPQRRALAVLDLGEGIGLATWGPAWWQGRAALRLKRFIDRRWLARYQGPPAR